jgi:outer membrane lipoprotein-sorting protein
MADLARRKSGEARFVEERTVSGLERPLQLSGRLSFTAPDRFARYTEQPKAESMEVVGSEVTLKRGKFTRRMSLDSVQELSAMADAMRGTLTGDASLLRRQFKVEFKGAQAQWQLHLTPLDARLAAQVQAIEISGRQMDIATILIHLAGGDRSLMRVEPLGESAAVAPPAP